MLPKKNRADKRTVKEVFRGGKFINSADFSFKFSTNQAKERKISFVVPKVVAKKAVDRNYLRRLGYSALEKHLKNFPLELAGVFVFKKYQNNISILENEIKSTFDKIH